MKLITRASDHSYLHALKLRLEGKGIPAVVLGENVSRVVLPFSLNQAQLWIYIDEQAYDADQLVLDEAHEVTTGVDVLRFYQQNNSSAKNSATVGQAYANLAITAIAIILGFFGLAWFLNSQ